MGEEGGGEWIQAVDPEQLARYTTRVVTACMNNAIVKITLWALGGKYA